MPAAVPITFTAKLQDVPAPSVEPVRLTLADPAVAEIVPPPQLPVSPLGVETIRPAGSVSVKPTPLKEVPELGFDKVNVNEVLALTSKLAAPNAFEIVGGNTLGGGATTLDEPPPQPDEHRGPKIKTTQHETERSCIGTFPLISRERRRG
jgi:hypothetical protein